MKARVMNAPKKQILIYGFEEEACGKFRRCADEMKLGLKILPSDCAGEKVGYLADFPGFSLCGESLEREGRCVIFSCIDGKTLNSLLDLMRERGLGGIPLKAAVTACNQKMTLAELMETEVDMFTTVFIGCAETKVIRGKMVTPRGYKLE